MIDNIIENVLRGFAKIDLGVLGMVIILACVVVYLIERFGRKS